MARCREPPALYSATVLGALASSFTVDCCPLPAAVYQACGPQIASLSRSEASRPIAPPFASCVSAHVQGVTVEMPLPVSNAVA